MESTTTNTRHAVTKGDGDKATAVIESTLAYTRHAIGDGDGGKARAKKEYITSCISTDFVLNGRKVIM